MKKSKLMLFVLSVIFTLAITCQPSHALRQAPDQPQKSAFGENLVGQLHPQFQGSFEYTVGNTDLNTNTVEEGGTVTQATAMAVCTTSTTLGSTARLESLQHARYRSGLGGLLRCTGKFTAGKSGTEQYLGIMDEPGSGAAFKNGYAFGYSGTGFRILRWCAEDLTSVSQANWNVDSLGAGALNPSGMTLVHTNLNVFQIRYQYLGAGAIEYYVEDDFTGKFILVHIIRYANKFLIPSVANPNFHFTMWASNGATTNNMILSSGSYAYFIEGKTSFMELHQPENSSGVVTTATVTTEVALFTIRNKATYASKKNFIDALLLRINIAVEASAANNLATIRVVKNATLGGTPSYSDISTSNSIMEIDVAGTTVTNGVELPGLFLAGKNDGVNLSLVSDTLILRAGDSVTIAGSSVNLATFKSLATWREMF